MELKFFTFFALTWVVLYSPVNSTTDPNDPCSGLKCPDCDRQCVLVKPYGKQVPQPQCTKNPCRPGICKEPEYCYPEEVICIKAPCNPVANCYNPCYNVTCQPGKTACTVKSYKCRCGYCPPYGKCENPCLYHKCFPYERCVPQLNEKNQTVAYCVNPCSTIRCRSGYTCQVSIKDGKPGGACVPTKNPCSGVKCKNGETCALVRQYCGKPPCPSVAQCTKNTCEGHSCPKGQCCYLQQVECFTTPCYPIPTCASPHDGVNCPAGYKRMLQNYKCDEGCHCPPSGGCVAA